MYRTRRKSEIRKHGSRLSLRGISHTSLKPKFGLLFWTTSNLRFISVLQYSAIRLGLGLPVYLFPSNVRFNIFVCCLSPRFPPDSPTKHITRSRTEEFIKTELLNCVCYTKHKIIISVCFIVGSLTLRRLMSYIYIYIYIYIYGAPILDVSRSHTTTQHSR